MVHAPFDFICALFNTNIVASFHQVRAKTTVGNFFNRRLKFGAASGSLEKVVFFEPKLLGFLMKIEFFFDFFSFF